MVYCILLTIVGIALTLVAQWKRLPTLHGLGKTMASVAFIALAFLCDAAHHTVGIVLLVALIFCAIGDLALIGRKQVFFLGGLVAFLLGHVIYVVLFVMVGMEYNSLNWPALIVGGLAVGSLTGFVYTKLRAHIPPNLLWPTRVYMVVISIMVMLAWGIGSTPQLILLPVGASLFYFSDLFVARDRFVHPTILNRCFGLPIYYGAQLIFAYSLTWAQL